MEIDLFKLPVHEYAGFYPMLDKEELAALAESIKVDGQQHPIVVQKGVDTEKPNQYWIIDGRNRLAACKLAGVEPIWEEKEIDDIGRYIILENDHRRHITKGQRAMAYARIYPETNQGKKSTSSLKEEVGSKSLSYARTVLKYAPDLVESVESGAKSLIPAYEIAKTRKMAKSEPTKQLEQLKESSPELATQVEEEELSLEAALVEQQQREQAEKANRLAMSDAVVDSAMKLAGIFEHPDNLNAAMEAIAHPDFEGNLEEIMLNLVTTHNGMGYLIKFLEMCDEK